MATLTIIEKVNTSGNPIAYGEKLAIDTTKLEGTSTKSVYIRKGKLNGTLFLSQRGNGSEGAGDICKLEAGEVEVSSSMFDRLRIFAEKANAIM